MLRSLQIKNYVLIDSLEVNFPAGLVIITGETGAGKSILLGAVSLLTGGRADSSVVGPAGDNCVVEGEFFCGDDQALKVYFQEEDLPWEDGNIVLRRVVSANGRSRCFICDEPVSKEVLAEISSRLVDIHSQHQTLKLSDAAFRLDVLDTYASNGELRGQCSEAFRSLGEQRRRLASVTETLERQVREREYNELMLSQLRDAHLRAGELEELDAEQKILSNAEEIKLSLLKVVSLFGGEEELSLTAKLKEASRTLSKLASYVPSTEELAGRIDSARAELDDILSDVASLEESTEVNQDRLQAVEERMSLLYSLMAKHSAGSVEELIAKRDALSGELLGAEELEQQKADLEKAIAEGEGKLADLAARLHKSREAAAGEFAKAVTKSLEMLSLEGAKFGVELQESPLGATGKDTVLFTFCSRGVAPADVSRAASGGELSRIMLSVKELMASRSAMPTMIFDEIDTGVSGSVADAVGSMICRMGENMQIFAITHLPQVAVKGKAHLVVTKEVSPQGTAVSRIHLLDDEERVDEIARLLSGSQITPQARANAKTLLQSSQNRK